MHGVITGRHVVFNARLIWREFGPACLARCVWACFFGPKTTFLNIMWESSRD